MKENRFVRWLLYLFKIPVAFSSFCIWMSNSRTAYTNIYRTTHCREWIELCICVDANTSLVFVCALHIYARTTIESNKRRKLFGGIDYSLCFICFICFLALTFVDASRHTFQFHMLMRSKYSGIDDIFFVYTLFLLICTHSIHPFFSCIEEKTKNCTLNIEIVIIITVCHVTHWSRIIHA